MIQIIKDNNFLICFDLTEYSDKYLDISSRKKLGIFICIIQLSPLYIMMELSESF